jgi:hypothetical protein
MPTSREFRWEVLEKYLAANPYVRFSLSRGRVTGGGQMWQAVLFKETGPVVARASHPERTPALEGLLAQVVKEWKG